MNVKLEERNRELKRKSRTQTAESALQQSKKHYHRLFNEARAMQQSLRNLSN